MIRRAIAAVELARYLNARRRTWFAADAGIDALDGALGAER